MMLALIRSTANALALLVVFLTAAPSTTYAAEWSFPTSEISVARQNEIIKTYCSICHLDSAKNGGLSLEHFDAATVSPSLAMMLVNKFVTGVPLSEILNPNMDAEILAEFAEGKKMGAPAAMKSAGVPPPPDVEINGFIAAMARRTENADQWHVVHDGGRIQADVGRSLALPVRKGKRELAYRLWMICDTATQNGEMILSWSPMPTKGTMRAIVDDGAPQEYVLDYSEPMANGEPQRSPPSSVVLHGTGKRDSHPALRLPRSSLKIFGPLHAPVGPIEFDFSGLRESDRTMLSACIR